MMDKEILKEYFWGVGLAFFVAGLLLMVPNGDIGKWGLVILGLIFIIVGISTNKKYKTLSKTSRKDLNKINQLPQFIDI